MTGIILTMASAGVMCVAGVGVSSALKWFHSYEMVVDKKTPREKENTHPHDERIKNLSRKIRK